MIKGSILRSFSGIALAGLAIAIQPAVVSADQWDPGSIRPVIGGPLPAQSSLDQRGSLSDSSSNSNPVYDISPAAAREAAAEVQYQQASSAFVAVTYHLQNEFRASSDYRTAVRAVEESRAAYESAAQPVMEQVRQNPDYLALILRRNNVDAALKSGTISPNGRVDLATRKMEYSAQAATIENAALRNDPTVRQAKIKYDEAVQALANKKAQFEASLYFNPSVVETKEALDTAAGNLAGARAALDGAMLARSDAIDADQRRYSTPATNYDPYYNGYNGFGYGNYGYGPIVIIGRGGTHGGGGNDHK